jgi:crotonobetainyl-CoA:carnitine CoA-transferase CaiB-like acyl-CoA transferase
MQRSARHAARLQQLSSHLEASASASAAAAASSLDGDEDGALAGTLVVELTTAIQGPAAGQYLRDMGAEVIKIEPATGDNSRHGRGFQNTLPRMGMEAQFTSANLGKKSLALNMKDPESKSVVLQLLAKADVFLANYTERALDDLGLGYGQLKELNPRIIHAVCSGFGPIGPLAQRKGFDGAAQAFGGIISATGTEEAPVMVGGAVADFGGATQLALGIMTALFRRERTGVGQEVRTSLYGSQLWSQKWSLTHVGMTGANLERQGSNAYPVAPNGTGVYPCADGAFIMFFLPIVGSDPRAAFRRLCEFGGLAEMTDDPRFQEPGLAMYGASTEDVDAIRQGIAVIMASHTLAEWEAWFEGEPDFVWSQVQDHASIMQEEQARANEYVVPVKLPHLDEPVPVVGNVIGLSESPGKVRGPPPLIGEHTADVMSDLGFDDAAVERK